MERKKMQDGGNVWIRPEIFRSSLMSDLVLKGIDEMERIYEGNEFLQ